MEEVNNWWLILALVADLVWLVALVGAMILAPPLLAKPNHVWVFVDDEVRDE